MKSIVLGIASALLIALPDDGNKTAASSKEVAAHVQEPSPKAAVPQGATLYHTLTGREAQVVFTTDAPLEKIVGKSNEVVGYAVSGPSDHPERLQAGVWVLPTESLATGIPLRDEHLAGSDWLDAKKHPNIEFELTGVEDLKEIKRGDGFSTWGATLAGKMTIHGTTKDLRITEARLSLFDESEKTKSIAPGKLLFIKCEYEIKLSDFGVQNKDVPQKVADTIRISQMLRMSTSPPESKRMTPEEKEHAKADSPGS